VFKFVLALGFAIGFQGLMARASPPGGFAASPRETQEPAGGISLAGRLPFASPLLHLARSSSGAPASPLVPMDLRSADIVRLALRQTESSESGNEKRTEIAPGETETGSESEELPKVGFLHSWSACCPEIPRHFFQEPLVALSAGWQHGLALRSDGQVLAWGLNDFDQAQPPETGPFVAVSAGGFHSLALRPDGTIVAWGANEYGQAEPPKTGDFSAISAGGYHSLALTPDGAIVGWGDNRFGQIDCPKGHGFTAISAGGFHNLALKEDGSIVAWGSNEHGQSNPPSGNEFVAVAAGGFHSLALKSDGSIVGWGANDFGQASPPEGNDFVAISAGLYHSLALRRDGTIVGWGSNECGQIDLPGYGGFFSIAAGGCCSYALRTDTGLVAAKESVLSSEAAGWTPILGQFDTFGTATGAVARGGGLGGGYGGYWGGGGGGSPDRPGGPDEPPFVIPEPNTIALLAAFATMLCAWYVHVRMRQVSAVQ